MNSPGGAPGSDAAAIAARSQSHVATGAVSPAWLRADDTVSRYELLALAEQSAGVGIWDIDLATDTVRGTPQFFRIMGLEPTDDPVPMARLRALRPQADKQRVDEGYRDAVETGADRYESEYRIRRPDGAVRWILGRGRVIRDDVGTPVRYAGVDIDITQRKATEEALAASEARLRLAVEAADLGIWDWDVRASTVTLSAKARVIFGFGADETVLFEHVSKVTHPEDLPRTHNMAKRALDPAIRDKQAYEYRVLRADGTVRWVLAHGEAQFAETDGQPVAIRYTGTIQDITDRKEAEERLRHSEARLRLAIDAARLAIWEYDVSRAAIRGSPDLNRILGFPENEPLDIAAVNAGYPAGEQDRIREAGQNALAAGERYFEVQFRYRWRDGSVRWLLVRAEILFTGSVPTGALGVLMDITAEMEGEEHRQMLLAELQHRTNNTLALAAAIANQTFRDVPDGAPALSTYGARLAALSHAHAMLVRENWQSAGLSEIIAAALAPFQLDSRFDIAGPPVKLPSRPALALALALNELATNAAKYGALSAPDGRVAITWVIQRETEPPSLHLTWQERGGPTVAQPSRVGFGTRLIRDKLASDFNGTVEIDYTSEGVVCTLSAPLP